MDPLYIYIMIHLVKTHNEKKIRINTVSHFCTSSIIFGKYTAEVFELLDILFYNSLVDDESVTLLLKYIHYSKQKHTYTYTYIYTT